MVVETNKEKLNLNKVVCEKEEMMIVEGDMIVPDSKPDILSTISTSGNICIYKKELMDEKIKIDGGINAYIMYMTDNADDNVRAINTNLDFSKMIDAQNCKENMILDMTTEIKSIECNVINGRKINLKVGINIKFKILKNENIELVNDIVNNNDIQVLKNTINVNSLVGYGSAKAYVKETIMIDNNNNLAEILKVNINMVDKDIKTSYNKVLAKAEAEVKIVYLTEDNKVVCCTNKIPIVGFVDIQNVTENNDCDSNFEIRNMIIKPNSVEDHSIYVELEVEVSCMSYEEKKINIIEDLYSPVQELECDKKEIIAISNKINRIEKCNINETINLPEIENSNIVDVDCMPKITNVNKLNSKINYEGEIEFSFIISGNNQINTIRSKIPFGFTVNNIENGDTLNIVTNIEIKEDEITIKTGEKIEVDLKLMFNINISKNENINIIENIETKEGSESEDYSLIIYIVKPGDTLWSIAKNLKSTIEDIIKANAIEDENNINAGKKLYIPRYVKYA